MAVKCAVMCDCREPAGIVITPTALVVCGLVCCISGVLISTQLNQSCVLDRRQYWPMRIRNGRVKNWQSKVWSDCYFVIAFTATSLSQMTVLSSTECSCRRPSSISVVGGHDSTIWFIVCEWRHNSLSISRVCHFCKLAAHWFHSVRMDHSWRGKLKTGSQIVWSDTKIWLTVEANCASSLQSFARLCWFSAAVRTCHGMMSHNYSNDNCSTDSTSVFYEY